MATVVLPLPLLGSIAAHAAASGPADASFANNRVEAFAIARAHQHAVMVENLQTPSMTVTANPNGSMTARVSSVPTRWQDSEGQWHALNLQPTRVTAGWRYSHAGPATMTLPTTANGGVRFDTSRGSIVLRHAGARSVVGQVGADGVTYRDAYVGANMVTSAIPGGFEESLVIADRTRNSYNDTLSLPAGIHAKQVGGLVVLEDGDGRLAQFGDGVAHDAAGAQTPVNTRLTASHGGTATVAVSVAAAWLESPSREFPVTIDPTFYQNTAANGSGAFEDWIQSDGTRASYDTEALRVGYGFGDGTALARTLIRFNLTALQKQAPTVESATLAMYNSSSSTCTPSSVTVRGMGASFSQSSTWSDTLVSDDLGVIDSESFAHGGPGCSGAWAKFDVARLVKAWLNGTEANNGLRVQTDETPQGGWRKFDSGSTGGSSAPALVITYAADPTYTQAVLADHPAAFWPLNDNPATGIAHDASGNALDGQYADVVQSGTGTQTAPSPDGSRSAPLFNGLSSEVTSSGAGSSIADNMSQNGDFSMEAWIDPLTYPSQANESGDIVRYGSGGEAFFLRISGGGSIQSLFNFGAYSDHSWYENKAGFAPLNTWTHVVATYSDGVICQYVDGLLVGRWAGYGPLQFSSVSSAFPLTIGSNPNQSEFFDGFISDVALYTSALTPTQILAHEAAARYTTPQPGYRQTILADVPTAYFPLDDAQDYGLANVVGKPASGGDPGNWGTGQQLTSVRAPGSIGSAAEFDGVEGSARLTSAGLDNTSCMGGSGCTGALTMEGWFKPDAYPTKGNQADLVRTESSSSSANALRIDHWGEITPMIATGGEQGHYAGQLPLGQWSYVALTYDEQYIRLYVDAKLVGQWASTQPLDTPFGSVSISSESGELYHGAAAQLAIYSSALPASTLEKHFMGAAIETSSPDNTYSSSVMTDIPVGYWPLNEASDNPHAYEAAGVHEADGTRSQTVGNAEALPTLGMAATFDGSSSEVSISPTAELKTAPASNEWAMEAWIRLTTYPAAGGSWDLVRLGTGGEGFFIRILQDGSVQSLLNFTGGYQIQTGGTVQLGVWTHLVVSYDGSTWRHYVNGAVAAEWPEGGHLQFLDYGSAIVFGANPAGLAELFDGAMSNVALYDRALDAGRVAAHYQAGVDAAHVELNLTDANNGYVTYGGSDVITATANSPLSQTNYGINLYNTTTGDLVAACPRVSMCSATVGHPADVQEYEAYVDATSESFPPSNAVAASEAVGVAPMPWGLILTLSQDDTTTTATATANQSVTGTGYDVQIFDAGSLARLADCDTGKTCTVTQTQLDENLIAYVAAPGAAAPPNDIQAEAVPSGSTDVDLSAIPVTPSEIATWVPDGDPKTTTVSRPGGDVYRDALYGYVLQAFNLIHGFAVAQRYDDLATAAPEDVNRADLGLYGYCYGAVQAPDSLPGAGRNGGSGYPDLTSEDASNNLQLWEMKYDSKVGRAAASRQIERYLTAARVSAKYMSARTGTPFATTEELSFVPGVCPGVLPSGWSPIDVTVMSSQDSDNSTVPGLEVYRVSMTDVLKLAVAIAAASGVTQAAVANGSLKEVRSPTVVSLQVNGVTEVRYVLLELPVDGLPVVEIA